MVPQALEMLQGSCLANMGRTIKGYQKLVFLLQISPNIGSWNFLSLRGAAVS
mgnify:FL=1